MRHTSAHGSTSTRDFLTYGPTGLEVARTNEHRAAIMDHVAERSPAVRLASTRRWLGTTLVTIGQHIAGTTAPVPAARWRHPGQHWMP